MHDPVKPPGIVVSEVDQGATAALLTQLREALAKPGRSQAALAKALGVHPSIVSKMLSGKREVRFRDASVIGRYLQNTSVEEGPDDTLIIASSTPDIIYEELGIAADDITKALDDASDGEALLISFNQCLLYLDQYVRKRLRPQYEDVTRIEFPKLMSSASKEHLLPRRILRFIGALYDSRQYVASSMRLCRFDDTYFMETFFSFFGPGDSPIPSRPMQPREIRNALSISMRMLLKTLADPRDASMPPILDDLLMHVFPGL